MEPVTNQNPARIGSVSSNRNEQQLWEIAKKRAAFKSSLASYFFVNTLLVAIWFFTSGYSRYFWPMWPLLGWGIGLAFQYAGAYHGTPLFSAEQEYERLKGEYEEAPDKR